MLRAFNRMWHCSFPFYSSFPGIISPVFLDSEASSCSHPLVGSSIAPVLNHVQLSTHQTNTFTSNLQEFTEGTQYTSTPQPLHQQNKRLTQTDEYLWSRIWLDHQWLTVLRTSSSVCLAIHLFSPNDCSRLIIFCFWKIALLIMEMEALWKAWISHVF